MTVIDQLVEELRGYMSPHVLAVAVDLGILDAFSGGSSTVQELGAACGIERQFLGDFLNVLRRHGLAEPVGNDDERFRLTPLGVEAASHPVFRSFAGYHAFNFEGWGQLRRICQTPGTAGGRFHGHSGKDPRFRQKYLQSMEAIAQGSLPFVRKEFRLLASREFDRVEGLRVLDLGAGPATFTRSLAADGAKVTAIDLPPLVAEARRIFGEPPSFSWQPGDFRAAEFSMPFDVVFCSHVLEYYDLGSLVERIESWMAPRALLVGVIFLRSGDPTRDEGLDLFEISTWLNGEEQGCIATIEGVKARLRNRFHRIDVRPIPSDVSYSEYLVTAARLDHDGGQR